MRYYRLKIALVLLNLTFYAFINAQISIGNIQDNQLEMNFLFDKIQSDAHKSIFNLLKIVNRSQIPYAGNLHIAVPREWQFLGETESVITIPPNDSVSIPIRVAITNNALGEIGYSVMATLIQSNGTNNAVSAYFYVTIPRKTDLKAYPEQFIYYIPEYQTKTYFNYQVQNRGNVQELLHLEMKAYNNINVYEDNRDTYIDEFALKSNTDTVVKIPIYTSEVEEDSRQYNRLDIKSYNNDTLYNQTIWFKILKDNYTFRIPENQKCAIIELNGYNIFGISKPSFTFQAKGSILFKKEKELYYYFYDNFENNTYNGKNYGHLNNAYIGFKNRFSDTRIGNAQGNYEQNINGQGISTRLDFGKVIVSGSFLEGVYSDYTGYGGSVSLRNRIANLSFGSVFTENREYNLDTKLAYAGTSFTFLKHNSVGILAGMSEFNGDSTLYKGIGLTLNYDFKSKRFIMGARARYGSPYYTGASGGRLDVRAYARYYLNHKNFLILNFEKQDFNYINYLQFKVTNTRISYSNRIDFAYGKILNNDISYRTGIVGKYESINNLYILSPDSFFNVASIGTYLESNIRFNSIEFLPRIEFSRANLVPYGFDSLNLTPWYNVINVSANLAYKNVGIYSLFKYGANSIFEHYIFSTTKETLKWFFLMPYYKKYFFKKSVLLDFRGNYIVNMNNNEKTFNVNTQLFWYLPHDFTLRFQNSIYNRSKIDLETNIKYTYSNLYFEVGLRKEFNCNQPRFQYHNLKIVFFRDINGDRVKNENEPGIINVLSEIVWDFETNKTKYSNFNDMQFLSDETGSVEYSNIQNGFYILKYQLLNGIIGNFSMEQLTFNFEMDKDKVIYIPYHENNKIIGKIILNRDPLTSLGPLDISNIRVTAEDTKGHTYSALSDKDGNFVLYTPQADHYVVKINNVFYESFDLQQSEFIVKFNGFKQFEITFVFNEKKRKISFSDVKTEGDKNQVMDDLQVIKKTTLTGKIRDAISLEPLDATIQIINNQNNKVVASAISNRLNGNYSISYAAAENYRIEVKSPEHWDHVENLYIEQIISIQNISKDIILNKISDGPKEQTYIIYDEKEQKEFKENFKSGQKIPVNNLNFNEKETRLSPKTYPDLDRLVDLLKKNSTIRIEVAGHADDTGADRTDNLLALRRAKAVARYLVEQGISDKRIEVKSYSNQRPLVPGLNEKARQQNRRVEITVL